MYPSAELVQVSNCSSERWQMALKSKVSLLFNTFWQ